jgi:hypothetical protein
VAPLAIFPFLGGSEPNQADYIALGAFQRVASASTLPPRQRADDTLRACVGRGFDLHGGLGRDARMQPLFE